MGSNGEETIVERAHARVGLLGNPSDQYFGKCLAVSLENFRATVTLTPSRGAAIEIEDDRADGGGRRLLESLVKVFEEYLGDRLPPRSRGFVLSYASDIPYQLGLAGSSAIICAGLRCLMRWFHEVNIPKPILPNLMLKAETDLGIVAGYMDRVIQVYSSAVFMDFSKEVFESNGHGGYEAVDPALLPSDLWLMHQREGATHKEAASGCSSQIHSSVRQRWIDAEVEVHDGMREFARIAERGREMILSGRGLGDPFAALMRANFALRRKLFGDAVLGRSNLAMVAIAESHGAAAKFCGSGGAILVYCPQGSDQAGAIETECNAKGYAFCKVRVAEQTTWDWK